MSFCVCIEGQELFAGEYATREQAIADAPGEFDMQPGDKFKTGLSRELGLPSIDGAHIIEQALLDLEDECGDAAEDAIDCTEEQERDLGDMLTETFRQWAAKHQIAVQCWAVDEVEEHLVPEAEGNSRGA